MKVIFYTKHCLKKRLAELKQGVENLDPKKVTLQQIEPWDSAVKELASELLGNWEAVFTSLGVSFLEHHADQKHSALLAMLEYMDHHVATVGVPKHYKARGTGIIVAVLIALLGGIFTLIGVQYSHYLTMEEKRHDQVLMAQATISSLRMWDQQDKDSFQRRFDSVRVEAAGRLGIRSGAYYGVLEKLAQKHHDYRIAKIDSFMIRLDELGVNTDTVNIDPRLAFRLGQYLKKAMLESLPYDQPMIENKIRELDRL